MPNYDAIYMKVAHPYGGGKPDPLIRLLMELVPQGSAVDLGAGWTSYVCASASWLGRSPRRYPSGSAEASGYANALNQKKIQTIR